MAFELTLFRSKFKEFEDPETYSPEVIALWQTLAYNQLNAQRFGNMLDYAAMLFIAHHLVIGRRNQLIVDAGGVPGELMGPKTAKSVDKVSASMDTKAVTRENAGFWNLSVYGTQLYQWMMMAGAGSVQLMC